MIIGRDTRASSKYKNRKVERGGIQYDSKKEAARGAVLELKQRAGNFISRTLRATKHPSIK